MAALRPLEYHVRADASRDSFAVLSPRAEHAARVRSGIWLEVPRQLAPPGRRLDAGRGAHGDQLLEVADDDVYLDGGG